MSWGDENNEKILSHEYLLKKFEAQHDGKIPIVGVSALMVIFTAGLLAAICATVPSFVGSIHEDGAFVRLMIIVLGCAIACLPMTLWTVEQIEWMIFQHKIKTRQYVVYNDTLIGVSPSEAYRDTWWERIKRGRGHDGRDHFHPTFYFSKLGRHPACGVPYRNVEKGDRFYVILLNGKKQKLLGVYAEKIYRWQGEPVPIKVEAPEESL